MSSISQEESIEGADPRPSFDKYEHRKSSPYPDNYGQESNSKYDEYSKFQNTGRSSSYDHSKGSPYQHGSPNQDESAEYMHDDSQIHRDNHRNTSGLEAVPERSVEHSEMTNKMSYMESEGQRWIYDEVDENRMQKSMPELPRGLKEHRYEQDQENIPNSNQQSNEKAGITNFISPRFQAESSEKKPRTKSRTLNERRNLGRDDHALRRPSQNNFNTLYNETFNRKAIDNSAFITNGRDDSIQESAREKNSSPSEKGYPQKLNKYISSRVGQKSSPSRRQNLSAFDFHVNERTSERYENGRLNKTEVMMPQSREDSFQGQEYSDMARVIRYERERNEKLEEKVLNKEKLLKQMKEFHEKIYQNYLEKKEEFEKTYRDKENLIKEVNKQNNQNLKLTEKVRELESRLRSTIEDLDRINQSESQKDDIIRDLEEQLAHANAQMDQANKKIDSLANKLNKKSQENKDIVHQRDKMMEKIDGYFHHKDTHQDDEDEEKHILRKNLDETLMQVRTLYKRNEELMREVEIMKKHGHERERASRDKSDDSFFENKRRVDGRMDVSHAKGDVSQHLQEELMTYKKKVAKLKVQNENLQLELESRPTLRRFKENELKIQSLENDLEGAKHHHHNHDSRKSTTEVSFTSRILRDIVVELEIENIGDIISRIKEVQEHSKANDKFVDSILELVNRCSPAGYFERKPTPKQAWRWIKRLMEEYMNIKKDNRETDESTEQEVLRETMDFLMVDDVGEISNKLRNVLVENNLMKRVVNKIKSIHHLEKITSIQELERRLETATSMKGNGTEARGKYHHQVSAS